MSYYSVARYTGCHVRLITHIASIQNDNGPFRVFSLQFVGLFGKVWLSVL